jgi:Protein of unknown function (DUF2510)
MSQDVSRSPGTFVLPRGAVRSRVAGAVVGGLAGLAIALTGAAILDAFNNPAVTFVASFAGGITGFKVGQAMMSRHPAESPLKGEHLGYLAVLADDVALFAAREGAFGRPKRADTVLATMPRSATKTARLGKGKLLEITFADGSDWTFDVRSVSSELLSALQTSPARPRVPAPGWYPDPQNRHTLRYWDGSAWTPHVSGGGVT